MGISKEEFDRKAEVVTNALYRLKERDFLMTRDVRAIDDMLAVNANGLVDLYDLVRFHDGPGAASQPPATWLDREDLIDEASDAIDDRMDMDVSYSMLAEAVVDRFIRLGVFYPNYATVVNGFRATDLFVCGLLSAIFGVGIQALFHVIPL